MPSQVPGRQRSEAEWQALKTHILKERQKKKQGAVKTKDN